MKLIHKYIDKNMSGSVTLIADGPEDMWHAYNLISVDDQLRSSTIRRVTNETATGSTTTSRVHTTLKICIKSIHFDTQASVLSLKGINVEENAYVKMGAYHTIDLEVNRKFTIIKREWDSVALDRIDEACDPAQNADLAAVVMQEGLAHLCLVLSAMTIVKAKIETHIPRKRKGLCSQHEKGLDRFFERIVQAILTHVNFDIVKAVIIASPGFVKDQFLQYTFEYALKNNLKLLLENKQKFVLVHSSSGFKHSLSDILHDPVLMNRLNDTKAVGEVKTLDAFYSMLKNEPARAYYGVKHVEKASEADAIDSLLIVDSLFRSQNLNERKRYVKIVDSVKANNGQVKIFSSLHVSGEQLLQLSGIAAILRFPMPDLEDEIPLSDDEDNEIIKSTVLIKLKDDEDDDDKESTISNASRKTDTNNQIDIDTNTLENTASAITTKSQKTKKKKSKYGLNPAGKGATASAYASLADDMNGDGDDYDDYGYDY